MGTPAQAGMPRTICGAGFRGRTWRRHLRHMAALAAYALLGAGTRHSAMLPACHSFQYCRNCSVMSSLGTSVPLSRYACFPHAMVDAPKMKNEKHRSNTMPDPVGHSVTTHRGGYVQNRPVHVTSVAMLTRSLRSDLRTSVLRLAGVPAGEWQEWQRPHKPVRPLSSPSILIGDDCHTSLTCFRSVSLDLQRAARGHCFAMAVAALPRPAEALRVLHTHEVRQQPNAEIGSEAVLQAECWCAVRSASHKGQLHVAVRSPNPPVEFMDCPHTTALFQRVRCSNFRGFGFGSLPLAQLLSGCCSVLKIVPASTNNDK